MTANVQHPKLASISYAVNHALKGIHAFKMLSAEQFNIIQRAFVPLDGPVIHKYNVTNVSTLYLGKFSSESFNIKYFSMNFQRNVNKTVIVHTIKHVIKKSASIHVLMVE